MVTYGDLYRRMKYALEPEEGSQAAWTARELLGFVTGYDTAAIMGMQSIYASEDTVKRSMNTAAECWQGSLWPTSWVSGAFMAWI